ncbi:MAG: hypothetical protein GTO20_07785 [Candidatus Aminicenantes bacterium]|nr:hypothetical protein [Candidatus Aminicenantes bacterium]
MEDVIFTTIIPIPNLDDLQIRDLNKTTPQVTMQDTMQDTMKVRKLLEACMKEKSREQLQDALGLKNREHFRKEYLNPAIRAGLIELTIPDKPNSKNQKYRITEKGKIFLKTRIKQHE